MRIPRLRQYCRMRRLLYPLSPTTRSGRCLGRPGPARLTAPPSISDSKTRDSCRCPGVSNTDISRPFPSARRWTLVPNPPWLRPSASASWSPFLHPLRAGARERWCHQHSGLPSSLFPAGRRSPAPMSEDGPRRRPCANGRSAWPQSATDRSALAGLATAHLSAESRVSRLRLSDGQPMAALGPASAAATAASAAPTARCSNLLGSYQGVYATISITFENAT